MCVSQRVRYWCISAQFVPGRKNILFMAWLKSCLACVFFFFFWPTGWCMTERQASQKDTDSVSMQTRKRPRAPCATSTTMTSMDGLCVWVTRPGSPARMRWRGCSKLWGGWCLRWGQKLMVVWQVADNGFLFLLSVSLRGHDGFGTSKQPNSYALPWF